MYLPGTDEIGFDQKMIWLLILGWLSPLLLSIFCMDLVDPEFTRSAPLGRIESLSFRSFFLIYLMYIILLGYSCR